MFDILNKASMKLSLLKWSLLACIIPSVAFAGEPKVAVKPTPMQPFEYGDVTLLPSDIQSKVQQTMEFYLAIPNDNILHGFRVRKGLEAPGTGLNKQSWYENNIYSTFGQFISGISRFYAATGDVRCREKANELVAEWSRTINEDGYFFFMDWDPNPHYTYEKTVCGLVDNYLFCGNEKALEHLSKITDWAIKNLNRTRVLRGSAESIEWYTLSENLYRAYQVTGDNKYSEFAKLWEYPEYWNSVADRSIAGTGGYHAYSHLNTFCGAAEAYRLTRDDYYLNTIKAAYDFFRTTQCLVTGGYGPNETVIYPSSEITPILENTANSFEVQCGSWAGFKLCKSLISFTGDGHYGDWIELLVINGVGASLPSKNDGSVFYYADYNPVEASKTYNPNQKWECCTGTRPQAMADIQNLVWFHSDKDLFLNLFIPSQVNWKGLTVTQKTVFPEEEGTVLEFSGRKGAAFTLGIRNPEWLAAPATVTVNGKVVNTVLKDGWLTVNRKWNPGDIVQVSLPMEFKKVSLPDGKDFPAALKYGPVTMAVEKGNAEPFYPSRDVFTAVKTPVEGNRLVFNVTGHPEIIVRPYYSFTEDEPYFIYMYRDVPPPNPIKKKGSWMGSISSVPGSWLEYSFDGTGLVWLGSKFDDAAMVEVKLDGKVLEVVDMYNAERGVPFRWEVNGLEKKEHKVRLTILEEKNPASRGYYINYSGFEVIQ